MSRSASSLDTSENADAQVLKAKELGYSPYARILGFKKETGSLLSLLKKQSEIPLITKTANASQILTEEAMTLFKQDLFASHVRQGNDAAFKKAREKTGTELRKLLEFLQADPAIVRLLAPELGTGERAGTDE